MVIPLFTDDFYQNPFFAFSVELSVKNSLPCAKIELSFSYRHHNLASHDLSFHVGICVVLTDIVPVLIHRSMRGKFFKPHLIIMMQTGFIIVDKHRGGNVHGIDQHQPFPNAAFGKTFLHVGCNVNKRPPGGDFKPEFFSVAFHNLLPRSFDHMIFEKQSFEKDKECKSYAFAKKKCKSKAFALRFSEISYKNNSIYKETKKCQITIYQIIFGLFMDV